MKALVLFVDALFQKTDLGRIKYILIIGPMAFIPDIVLAFILANIFDALGVDVSSMVPSFEEDIRENAVWFICSAVVIIPFIETLIMGACIRLLQKATKSLYMVALISAILWAILHSLQAPFWGVGVVWGFFVFSVTFTVWSSQKFMTGVWAATGVHGLNNLAAVTLMML